MAQVILRDSGADEIFIWSSEQRGDLREGLDEGLPFIVDIAAQVEFLFGVLDGGPTDTDRRRSAGS